MLEKKEDIIVLLSGGMDSATLLWLAKQKFKNVYTISFQYGQKHSVELDFAKKLSSLANVKRHIIVDIPHLKQLGGSALTDESIDIPSEEYPESSPPITTVPMRNLTFISIAASFCDIYEIENIGLGIHSVDSPYPDCRAEFASSAEAVINASSIMVAKKKNRIKVFTPFLGMSKADIVKLGLSLNVPYELTYSCYRGTLPPCGECATCRQRDEAFKSVGVEDPLKKRFNH